MAHMMETEPASDRQRDRLRTIRESGRALLQVLNDILDFSKIEAGKLETRPAEFDLEDLVRGATATFAESAAAMDLQWGYSLPEALKGVWFGDGLRIRQILMNLLSNALKFTDRGSVSLRIEPTPTGLSFAVCDTGIGVPTEQHSKLFSKFSQIDASDTRRFGGTGLGLVICRELAQLMGGTIDFQSTLDVGSTFTLCLPLAKIRDVEALVPVVTTPNAGPEVAGEMIRILAAEDNSVNREVLAALLGAADIDLTLVEDGRIAVETWRNGAFDLILMDIQMPNMGGVEATQVIRSIEAERGFAPIPIIALTANVMSHQVGEYLSAGMNAYLAKPIDPAELFRTIGETVAAAPAAGPRKAARS
jgi:CheY-like chemotaxis protein